MTTKLTSSNAPLQREIHFSFYQRFCLTSLLGRQTFESIKKAIGREVAEDDAVALSSVRRKVKTSPADIAPFTKRFGGDSRVDLDTIAELPEEAQAVTAILDTGEARMLKAFLIGWLKVEGALGDRDWADPIIAAC